MNHQTLKLKVSHETNILDGKEWADYLSQIHDSSIADRSILLDILCDESKSIIVEWIHTNLDKTIHYVSKLFTELTFEIFGNGNEWHETWKNGKRVKFWSQLLIARPVMGNSMEDPEINRKCVQEWYQHYKKEYDDAIIKIGDLEIENDSIDNPPNVKILPTGFVEITLSNVRKSQRKDSYNIEHNLLSKMLVQIIDHQLVRNQNLSDN